MRFTIYQVDSFADTLFSGNPAAVCPLSDGWLEESFMQHIAGESQKKSLKLSDFPVN
jgi:predicted PhzF superfamily epimerase YddE/YHI9